LEFQLHIQLPVYFSFQTTNLCNYKSPRISVFWERAIQCRHCSPSIKNISLIWTPNIFQWFVAGWWFSPDYSVSATNKTDWHDITEILLKVALNTIEPNQPTYSQVNYIDVMVSVLTSSGVDAPIRSNQGL
jgi:hypothetical protein